MSEEALISEDYRKMQQQPPAWWLPKFLERFELANFNRVAMGFMVVVERKRGMMSASSVSCLPQGGRP